MASLVCESCGKGFSKSSFFPSTDWKCVAKNHKGKNHYSKSDKMFGCDNCEIGWCSECWSKHQQISSGSKKAERTYHPFANSIKADRINTESNEDEGDIKSLVVSPGVATPLTQSEKRPEIQELSNLIDSITIDSDETVLSTLLQNLQEQLEQYSSPTNPFSLSSSLDPLDHMNATTSPKLCIEIGTKLVNFIFEWIDLKVYLSNDKKHQNPILQQLIQLIVFLPPVSLQTLSMVLYQTLEQMDSTDMDKYRQILYRHNICQVYSILFTEYCTAQYNHLQAMNSTETLSLELIEGEEKAEQKNEGEASKIENKEVPSTGFNHLLEQVQISEDYEILYSLLLVIRLLTDQSRKSVSSSSSLPSGIGHLNRLQFVSAGLLPFLFEYYQYCHHKIFIPDEYQYNPPPSTNTTTSLSSSSSPSEHYKALNDESTLYLTTKQMNILLNLTNTLPVITTENILIQLIEQILTIIKNFSYDKDIVYHSFKGNNKGNKDNLYDSILIPCYQKFICYSSFIQLINSIIWNITIYDDIVQKNLSSNLMFYQLLVIAFLRYSAYYTHTITTTDTVITSKQGQSTHLHRHKTIRDDYIGTIREICGAISNLSANYVGKIQFGNLGFCCIVTNALKYYEEKEEIMRMLYVIIANLAVNNYNKRSFSHHHILHHQATPTNTTDTPPNTLAAITHDDDVFERLTSMLKKYLLLLMNNDVSVMSSSSSVVSLDTMKYLLIAMKNLSLTIVNQQRFAKCDVIVSLVQCLQQYQYNEEIVRLALDTMTNLISLIKDEEEEIEDKDKQKEKSNNMMMKKKVRRNSVKSRKEGVNNVEGGGDDSNKSDTSSTQNKDDIDDNYDEDEEDLFEHTYDGSNNLLIHHHKYLSVLHHSYYYHFHTLPTLQSYTSTFPTTTPTSLPSCLSFIDDEEDNNKKGPVMMTDMTLTPIFASYYLPIMSEEDSLLYQLHTQKAKENENLLQLYTLQKQYNHYNRKKTTQRQSEEGEGIEGGGDETRNHSNSHSSGNGSTNTAAITSPSTTTSLTTSISVGINITALLTSILVEYARSSAKTILSLLKTIEQLLFLSFFQQSFHQNDRSLLIVHQLFRHYSNIPSQSSFSDALLCQINLVLKQLCYYEPNIETLCSYEPPLIPSTKEEKIRRGKGNTKPKILIKEDEYEEEEDEEVSLWAWTASSGHFCEVMMHTLIRQIHEEDVIYSQLMVIHQLLHHPNNIPIIFTTENCQLLVTLMSVHMRKEKIVHEIIYILIIACQSIRRHEYNHQLQQHQQGKKGCGHNNNEDEKDVSTKGDTNEYADRCRDELGGAGMCEVLCEALAVYSGYIPTITSTPSTLPTNNTNNNNTTPARVGNTLTSHSEHSLEGSGNNGSNGNSEKIFFLQPKYRLKMIQDLCYVIAILMSSDHRYNQERFATNTSLPEIVLSLYNRYLLNMEVMSALCLVIFNSIRHPIFYSKYSSTNDSGNIHVLLTSTLSNHLSNIDISMIVIDIMHSLLLPPHYSATTSEVVDGKKEKKKENRLSFFLKHHPHRFHVNGPHDDNYHNKMNYKEEEKEKFEEKEEKRIDEQLKHFSYCMISPSLALGKLLMTSWNNYLLNSDFILHITPVILLLGMDITSYKEWVLSASPNNPTYSAHHHHHHHPHHTDHDKQPSSSDHRPVNNITHDKTLRKLLNHLQPCYEENLNIFSQSGGCELVMQSIVKYKKHASVVFLLCPIIRMLLTIQLNDNNYLRFYEMNVTDVLTELLKIYQLDSNSGNHHSKNNNNNNNNNNDIMIRELCQTIFMTLQSSSYQFDYLNSYGNLGLCDLLATLLAKQLSLPTTTTSSSTPPTLPLPPAMTEGSSGSSSSGMTEKQEHHHLFFSRREKVSLTECQQLELRIIETLCTVEETKQRFQQTAIAQTLANARHHHHYGVHSHTDHCIVS